MLAGCVDGSSPSNNNAELGESRFIVIPERDPSQPYHIWDETVRLHLGNQRCVIVPGHLDGLENFSKSQIAAARGPLNQEVEWQGVYVL